MFENINISISCIMLKFKKQIAFTFLKSWVFFPINRVGIISFFIDIKGRISGCVGGDVCEWFVFGVEVGLGVLLSWIIQCLNIFSQMRITKKCQYIQAKYFLFHRDNGCLHC